ncbi:MAG: WD repeat-containing protein [Amphiamblys sp. WSBS2006]|nr:MAG: WD repeat-containing protein [Amphiamblys sp. WSBS2006]
MDITRLDIQYNKNKCFILQDERAAVISNGDLYFVSPEEDKNSKITSLGNIVSACLWKEELFLVTRTGAVLIYGDETRRASSETGLQNCFDISVYKESVFILQHEPEKNAFAFYTYCRDTEKTTRVATEKYQQGWVEKVLLHQNNKHVVFALGKTVTLIRKGTAWKTKLRSIRRVTAIHADRDCLLIGDNSGVITAISGIEKITQDTQIESIKHRKTYHWHSGEVKTLFRTVDKQHFVSGGKEGVLVLWTEGGEDNKDRRSTQKRFLPRLGDEIVCAAQSPSGKSILVSTSENNLSVVDAGAFTVKTQISGMSKSRILFCNKNIFIEKNKHGEVQVYSPAAQKETALLDLCGYNNTRPTSKKHQTNITALWCDETRLVSCEETKKNVSLKLWSYGREGVDLVDCSKDTHTTPAKKIVVAGNTMVTVDTRHSFYLWNIETGLECVQKKSYKEAAIKDCALREDGEELVTLHNGILVYWAVRDGAASFRQYTRLAAAGHKKIDYTDAETVCVVSSSALLFFNTQTRTLVKKIDSCGHSFCVGKGEVFSLDRTRKLVLRIKRGEDTFEQERVAEVETKIRKLYTPGEKHETEFFFVGDDRSVFYVGRRRNTSTKQIAAPEANPPKRMKMKKEKQINLRAWNRKQKDTPSHELSSNCLSARTFFAGLIGK